MISMKFLSAVTSQMRGSVKTNVWAFETPSKGELTRIADNRYRFNSDEIAKFFNVASEIMPSKLMKFRNNLIPLKYCL
jgi:hypothetical protein